MTKVYKRYNLLIQLVILIVSYFFIIKQVFWKQDLPSLLKTLEKDFASPGFSGMMTVIFVLMLLNWYIETLKWKKLISKVEKISFGQALEAVLTGVTISSFTPNRIGEFFGRAFILKKASHIEGILITILGSMSQLLVTILTGSIALLVFLPVFVPATFVINGYLYIGVITLVLILDLLLMGLFFNVSFLANFKEKLLHYGLGRISRYFRVFSFYTNKELWQVMGLSFARYVVFSSQYVLLLWMLDVSVPFYYAYIMISMIYFIMAVIPTVALTELGIRGSVAIYLFSFYFTGPLGATSSLNLGILISSVILWVINLGIPAIAGSLFLFRLQFFRSGNGSA